MSCVALLYSVWSCYVNVCIIHMIITTIIFPMKQRLCHHTNGIQPLKYCSHTLYKPL